MRNHVWGVIAIVAGLLLPLASIAQPITYPRNGAWDEREGYYAFTRATIVKSAGEVVENGTLIIRNGKIEQIGAGLPVPQGAVEYDCKGKWIYPSFVELYSNYGMPEPKAPGTRGNGEQMLSNQRGAYGWNEALKPDFEAYTAFATDEKKAEELRKLGVGAVLTHQYDGLARGTGALVLTLNEKENSIMVKDRAAAFYSFNKGTSTQGFPSSLMGAIALFRQTYLDAAWYAQEASKSQEYNITLGAWNAIQDLPQVFEVRNRLEALRADKMGDEFKVQYIFRGSGDEYQRLGELKKTGATFLLPLNFPKAYDVSDPYEALLVDFNTLKHWELAPYNPARVAQAGIPFAITSSGLAEGVSFWSNLRKAVKHGLNKDTALRALTTVPAKIAGVDALLGSLAVGKFANFLIFSEDMFEEKSVLHHHWIKGKPHVLAAWPKVDLRGEYTLTVGNKTEVLKVKDTPEAPSFQLGAADTGTVKLNATIDFPNISLSYIEKGDNSKQSIRLSGIIGENNKMSGEGQLGNGDWVKWTAAQTKPWESLAKKDSVKIEIIARPGEVIYPFEAYGNTTLPVAADYLIKNATVWTNEKEGILSATDVLISNGKIAKIGKNLSAPAGATTIDGSGKHLTSGIIDEHSHIALSNGVNEGTQASSAEVRIGDVINSEDINIYRQLAGGVTMCQQLHGSANPIGGQSAIIKLRWGYAPEDMKFKEAKPFIKFALGENVKQSNWGDNSTSRFPQTRMGVEQVFDDHFTRAREYSTLRKTNPNSRRDLELECLAEILESKRFITCHSYVQSEILMLMRLAEKHGFRVNTFTHILEGYKVADEMKKHGVGASSFADWWAYKMEVQDAIPYNPAILAQMGVVTALNSDDAEMARRLNQEAAKVVKYGNISEEEAWKMVTLNPAKLLRIDDYVGSVKNGKDADLVLWSDNPLSIYAHAEKTFVDGILFFDIERDLAARQAIAQERQRLIQKMIGEKDKGADVQKPAAKHHKHYHCDDREDELHDEE